MSENQQLVAVSAASVFAVLGNGWTYSGWVVGASRIRDVDKGFPAPGSDIHHSVGVWPLLLDDTTSVEECVEPEYLRLKVRAWPSGAGRVEFFLADDIEGCRVRMHERAIAGPARLLPEFLTEPLLHARNAETLRRLALLAEAHADGQL